MIGHYFLEMQLILKQPRRQQETHTHSHLPIHWINLNQYIIMRPLIIPKRKPRQLDLLILPLTTH